MAKKGTYLLPRGEVASSEPASYLLYLAFLWRALQRIEHYPSLFINLSYMQINLRWNLPKQPETFCICIRPAIQVPTFSIANFF